MFEAPTGTADPSHRRPNPPRAPLPVTCPHVHSHPGASRAGWYEVARNDEAQFWFVLKAGNAQVILRSPQYETKASALDGVASVQTHSLQEERFELKTASDGRPFFNLEAANGQAVGTSQMVASEATRRTGIDSVKTNGPSADVREVWTGARAVRQRRHRR